MTEYRAIDEILIEAIVQVRGIVRIAPLDRAGRDELARIEREAEEHSLMGLGKVVNTGVREVLKCERVYAALTDMEFDWGCKANLLMKKDGEVVGEEVTGKEKIERLAEDKDVWFMHRNFVVYKSRVDFPKDVMRKICYFEIPSHEAEWDEIREHRARCRDLIYGSPSTPGDVYLKNRCFDGSDEKGTGTIIIGVA